MRCEVVNENTPGKPLLSVSFERKSVKESCKHFTAWGQCAHCTVADCAPIAVSGSRPAFVDLRDTLQAARATAVLSRPTRGAGWGHRDRRKHWKINTQRGWDHVSTMKVFLYNTDVIDSRERRFRTISSIAGCSWESDYHIISYFVCNTSQKV